MSRLFNDAASDKLLNGGAILTAAPMTVHAWAYTDDVTVDQAILSLGDTAGTANYFELSILGTTAGDPIQWRATNTTAASAITSTGVTVNTWHSCLGRETTNADRDALIDGGSKVNNTTSKTPTSIDATGIGVRKRSNEQLFFSGRIAEVAVWNVALDGFGLNPVGGPRTKGKRSAWDTVHPGRSGRSSAPVDPERERELLKAIAAHLNSTVPGSIPKPE